jgi:RHS repeat-associated protein
MITATTSSGTTTYTYDYQNQLTNVEANGVMVATYTYNALGQRIGIKDNGTQTWTVYNGNSADANPYADFSSSGSVQTRYLDGLAVDQIFGQTSSSGSTEWYLTDQLGSVVAIASTSAVLDQITYDPFGNIVTQTNDTDAVRFGFAGMEFDSVTGLYYDHARYYDAAIGRFTSQDPKSFSAGDTNLYRYVGNDPAGADDPNGMQDLQISNSFPTQPDLQTVVQTPDMQSVLYSLTKVKPANGPEAGLWVLWNPVSGAIKVTTVGVTTVDRYRVGFTPPVVPGGWIPIGSIHTHRPGNSPTSEDVENAFGLFQLPGVVVTPGNKYKIFGPGIPNQPPGWRHLILNSRINPTMA